MKLKSRQKVSILDATISTFKSKKDELMTQLTLSFLDGRDAYEVKQIVFDDDIRKANSIAAKVERSIVEDKMLVSEVEFSIAPRGYDYSINVVLDSINI